MAATISWSISKSVWHGMIDAASLFHPAMSNLESEHLLSFYLCSADSL